ncbi:hypothetical protein RFI_00745 [Reticulomyxa filosa]|uniref:Uncharacterized protein n=1 Tax=Reticulomyxa filosa TaxID=46433 RepID=X6PE35_RETFI|nr:hypothetical protein RFI_00745 [Reticulomyxa filosa]|eukprot:ETO36319.1 hypothetical protein RFI_00745 [Reticulomyxa filosa]
MKYLEIFSKRDNKFFTRFLSLSLQVLLLVVSEKSKIEAKMAELSSDQTPYVRQAEGSEFMEDRLLREDRESKEEKKKYEIRTLVLDNLSMELLDYKSNNKRDIYFTCIAPYAPDYIDLYTDKPSDLLLKYCCGLYMPIDQSFTVHNMLSSEFLTAIKQQVTHLQHKKKTDANKCRDHSHSPQSRSKPSDEKQTESNTSPLLANSEEEEKKEKDTKEKTRDNVKDTNKDEKIVDECDLIPISEMSSVLKVNPKGQRVVIFIPGYDYTSPTNATEAAQMVLNDSIQFYQYIDQIVIPFLWPTEGYLINNDEDYKSKLAIQVAGHLLSQFVQRLHLYFEFIDFVGHSEGCSILCVALEQLIKTHNDICKNKSHVLSKIFVSLFSILLSFCLILFVYNYYIDRAGHSLITAQGLDTIDVTEVTASWTGSNHYYLTDENVIRDVAEALSVDGGKDCPKRRYLKKVYSGVDDRVGHYILCTTLQNSSDVNESLEKLKIIFCDFDNWIFSNNFCFRSDVTKFTSIFILEKVVVGRALEFVAMKY